MIRHFLLLILVLTLAFGCVTCGGGNSAPPANNNNVNWHYVALGDSLAFGIAAIQGYVPRYADDLRQDNGANVTLTNLGVNGWHSDDLANALRTDASFRTALADAQVITLDIGGNDLLHARNLFSEQRCGGADNQDCFRAAVADFTRNWDDILAQVVAIRDPRTTILRTMDLYYPFVVQDKTAGVFTIFKPYLDQVNAHIRATAPANGFAVAAVQQAFNGASGEEDPVAKGFISPDGFHPNDAGHRAIAEALRALGYAPLK